MQLRKETLLIGILQDHIQRILISEVAVHLEDVWMVHVELQFHLLDYLTLHLLLFDLKQVDDLQGED